MSKNELIYKYSIELSNSINKEINSFRENLISLKLEDSIFNSAVFYCCTALVKNVILFSTETNQGDHFEMFKNMLDEVLFLLHKDKENLGSPLH